MIENITKQIHALLSGLKMTYARQGQAGKILIPAVILLACCCLFSVLMLLLPPRTPASAVPSPSIFPTDGAQPTPTALFNFDFPTFTPFPTLPPPSAFPSLTPLPTETPTATQPVPTETLTAIPTATDTPLPTATGTPLPTATATSAGSVVIIAVDKRAEYVDIQNFSPAPVNLRGWRLVSETGNQSCDLRGTLEPDEILRIWADRGNPGFDCRFSDYIWRNDIPDPAVLYNPDGEEVSRYP